MECNKGSHCVPCSPSSGVVVGVWNQGPLAPGGFSEGALQPWVHCSHKSRLWLLDGHSVSASVATATRSPLLVQQGRWLVPLHRAAENLGLWNRSFVWERTQRKEHRKEEQSRRLWGNVQCLWLSPQPRGQPASASQLLTGPFLLPTLQRLLSPRQPLATTRAFPCLTWMPLCFDISDFSTSSWAQVTLPTFSSCPRVPPTPRLQIQIALVN